MKKGLIYALCTTALVSASPMSAQEVTYVEDCSQGLLFNRNKDNWFITARGGANFSFGKYDMKAPDKDRIGATASIFAGKWVHPIFGLRFGFNMTLSRGGTTEFGDYRDYAHGGWNNGFFPKKYYALGVEADALINMTNWICGYRPGRTYNAVVHGGVGSMWALRHNPKGNKIEWRYNWHNRVFYINLGVENNFRISDAVDVFVDLEGQINDWTRVDYIVNLQAGFTYKFKKREWNCPITAVCPTWKYTDAEGDALQARLAEAEGKINDIQRQLDDCLNAPKDNNRGGIDCDALATVYYPINVYTLGKREMGILTSVAQVMKQNPDKKYLLTGWADNYTGNDEINVRLRHSRVDGVKNFLIKSGVSPDQLNATIDNNNLTDFGINGASLDRAVTIVEAK